MSEDTEHKMVEQESPQSLKQKPKRSLFDHVINFICIIILIGVVINEYSHLHKPPTPMGEYTALYQKHIVPTGSPPFLMSYYLLVPENYDPAYKYPLVLALHGVSNYVYAGMFLARPEFRKRYPVFVLIPILSKRSVWAMPENKAYALQRGGIKYPDAIPQAVSMIRKTQSRYNVDPSRIYVTGHSMGGIGTFGALAHYPDVFAAGLVVSGTWDPNTPYLFKDPVLAIHGGRDQQIPPEATRQLIRNIKDMGGMATYSELPKAGHDVWKSVYDKKAVWDWLSNQ